jgi:outer membrane receptor for ferrienterochelin and colicins
VSGPLVFRNYEKVDAIGAEVSLQAKWENGLQGKLSYTWQDASIVGTGARLTNSPRNMAKANISVPVFSTNTFLSPELQYTSPRLTLAGNRTKDVVLANLTLFSRDLIKGLETSASIYNLFNTSYSDPVGAEFVQDTIRQDGIDFRFKLTYRF